MDKNEMYFKLCDKYPEHKDVVILTFISWDYDNIQDYINAIEYHLNCVECFKLNVETTL